MGRIFRPVPACSPANLKRRTTRSRNCHREQNCPETEWINLELKPSWDSDVRKSIRIEVLASWSPDVMSTWCPKIKSSWTRELQRSWSPDLRSSWRPGLMKSWNLELRPCWGLGLMASWSPGVMFSWPQEPLKSCFPEFMIPWVTDLLSPWSIDVCRGLYVEDAEVLGLLPPPLSDWQSPSSVRPKAECQIFCLARQRNVFQYAIWTLTDANLCHTDANHCHRGQKVEKAPPLPLYSLPRP